MPLFQAHISEQIHPIQDFQTIKIYLIEFNKKCFIILKYSTAPTVNDF